MSKQIQVNEKISEKNHSSLFFFLFFFLIKKYNVKNIILLFYKFKGRNKWLVFILFFKKFPNHRGILVRKHQKINSSSKLRKIHVQIPKEMTTYAGILVKKKIKKCTCSRLSTLIGIQKVNKNN